MMSTGRTPRQIHGQVYDDHMNDHFVLSNDNGSLTTQVQLIIDFLINMFLTFIMLILSLCATFSFATGNKKKWIYQPQHNLQRKEKEMIICQTLLSPCLLILPPQGTVQACKTMIVGFDRCIFSCLLLLTSIIFLPINS